MTRVADFQVNGRRDKTAASVGQYERLWARIKAARHIGTFCRLCMVTVSVEVFWMMGVLLAVAVTAATSPKP